MRAVASPDPVSNLEDDAGEKAVARMASPWPGIDAEHLDTDLTRKTAWGVKCKLMESSVVLRPGLRSDWYRLVEISRALSNIEGSDLFDLYVKR